ncbi:hypothetical protein GQX74_012482 [Glossina fuscipes]|nr:hypothetical protein GQX74_012482 [Glossina fuscipes]
MSEAVLTVATCGFDARDAHGVARLSCDVKKPCCETLWPNLGCDMPNLDPRSVKKKNKRCVKTTRATTITSSNTSNIMNLTTTTTTTTTTAGTKTIAIICINDICCCINIIFCCVEAYGVAIQTGDILVDWRKW